MLNDADAVNSDIALDLSIYGRATRLCSETKTNRYRFLTLDPKNTFVIYNHDIDKEIIAGVRYYDTVDDESETVNHIEVYTATHLHSFVIRKGELSSVQDIEHHYNEVPIIEYLNNKFKQGDFENVRQLD